MTVATTERKQSFTTNGVTVNFPFTFKATDANQIYCQYTPDGGNTADYTNFTVVLQEAGGTVTTNDVLVSGTLLVYRIVPLTQNTDYVEGGRFPAESHEAALDKLTLIDQDQQEDISRALKGPIGKDNPYTLAETLTEDELLIMQTNEIKSSGTTIADLNNAIDNANSAAQNAEKVLINLPSGQWAAGIKFNAANEFMNFNGVGYTPLPTTAFPYVTQGNDPTLAPDNAFVQPFSNVNSSNLSTYTDLVFDSVADMIIGVIDGKQFSFSIGQKVSTGATTWIIGNSGKLSVVGGLFATPLNGCHLIDFKLVADGVTDDSPLIEQWWNIGGTLIGYEAEVAYSGAGLAESSLTKNLKLMGNGLVINCTNASSQYYFILIDVAPSSTAKYITVKGISINANSKFAYGVRIQGDAAAPAVSLVEVSGCTVQALDNANLGTITTCAGIQVSCNSSNTQIKENFINDVTRTQVNPGFASSVGIIATNVTSILNIENNNIRSISSPTGDADADGIVVFGVNTGDIPAVRQQLLPTIHGNKITQCKGRFVKLQCANGKVYNNFMESLNIEMITNFRGIDAQIGGCQIYGNFIRLKDSVSLESASFVNISSRENGGLENIYLVHDNEFLLEGAMAYAVTISADENTDTSIKIRDNDIKSADPSNVSVTNMCLLGLPENADRFSLTVTGNEIPLKNGQMFFATSATAANWTDATKGPIMSDFVSIIATENHNTHPDVNTDIFNPSNVIPYVQDIVIRGNKGFDRASLYLKGFDAFKAPDGNQFYFATDGSTGGVINAPAGLNRDVVVETMGYNTVKLTKFTGTSFAIAAQSIGTWSTYTGT